MQGSWPGTSQSIHEEDLAKEQSNNKHPKTLADRFTAVFNKKSKAAVDGASKHGGEGSSTSTPKFSDRWVLQFQTAFVERWITSPLLFLFVICVHEVHCGVALNFTARHPKFL